MPKSTLSSSVLSSNENKEIFHRSTGKTNKCTNMGSYNYLGFAENKGLCAEDAIRTVHERGVSLPSTRRELGNASYLRELDKLVAEFVGHEDAITCGMGFATNALNLPCILDKNCLVVSDEKNHSSIILGLRTSGATIHVFEHNSKSMIIKYVSGPYFVQLLPQFKPSRYEESREAAKRRYNKREPEDETAVGENFHCCRGYLQYGRFHCPSS